MSDEIIVPLVMVLFAIGVGRKYPRLLVALLLIFAVGYVLVQHPLDHARQRAKPTHPQTTH